MLALLLESVVRLGKKSGGFERAPAVRQSSLLRDPDERVSLSVMARVNLTLDQDTAARLSRHAKHLGLAQAAAARELIREALTRRESLAKRRALARDYAAGRSDAAEILRAMEAAQIDLLDED